MNKQFKLYMAAWAVLLVLFNVIAFVSVGWIGQEKYTASFWIGYVLITIMFIGQLLCAYVGFKADRAKTLFYNISLITTSYTGLITSFIVGGLCMLISPLPYWVGAIACAVVLAVNIIAVIKVSATIDEVERIDEKVNVRTLFIRSLTVDAEGLIARASSDAVKKQCKSVYETVRYSDPMSHEALVPIESEIADKFSAFVSAVKADDEGMVRTVAEELVVLIGDRNKKCKILK